MNPDGIVQSLDENVVDQCNWVTKMSKAGKPYSQLQVVLVNGLVMDLMIERPYAQIIEMLLNPQNSKPKS